MDSGSKGSDSSSGSGHCVVLCCAVLGSGLCCAVLCCSVLYCAVLCCVLGQDNLFSQCLSPPKSINGVPANCQGNLTKCCGVTFDGLASHPGGVAIFLVLLWYGNRDKLRQCEPRAKFGSSEENMILQLAVVQMVNNAIGG